MNTSVTSTEMSVAQWSTTFHPGALEGVDWKMHDDLCDHIYQRIGQWTNPYLGSTHELRLCCIWAKLYEQYPEYVRDVPGWFDHNTNTWQEGQLEWNGEDAMPRAIWYRQLAVREGRPLSEIRAEYADQEPPRGVPVPLPQVVAMLDVVEIAGMESANAAIDIAVQRRALIWRRIAENHGLDPEAAYELDNATGRVTC